VTVALVVGTADPDALITFSRERRADFKTPRRIIAVDALPRSAGGEVMKGELQARRVG
jgi:hypothetical protein